MAWALSTNPDKLLDINNTADKNKPGFGCVYNYTMGEAVAKKKEVKEEVKEEVKKSKKEEK